MIAYSLSILYIISYFVHLTARVQVLSVVRFDLLLAVLIVIAIALESPPKNILDKEHRLNKAFLFFVAYLFVTLPLVKWPGSVLRFGFYNYIKVVLFYFIFVSVATTRTRLNVLVFVFIACQTIRVFEPAYLHYATGYWGDVAFSVGAGVHQKLDRLAGAPSDVVNSNQLAWVIVTNLTFVFYFFWQDRGLLCKLLSILIAVVSFYALVLTASRSGILSLGILCLSLAWFSKKRMRNMALVLTSLLAVMVVGFSRLPSAIQERYLSLFVGGVAGSDTVKGRISGILNILGTHDIYFMFGHGLGTSGETNYNVVAQSSQITHNLYVEIYQELGVAGLLVTGWFAICIWKYANKVISLASDGAGQDKVFANLGTMVKSWMVMHLVYSVSCFGLRSWEWYVVGGLVSSLYVVMLKQAQGAGPEGVQAAGYVFKSKKQGQ